jgi:hypothetical protein
VQHEDSIHVTTLALIGTVVSPALGGPGAPGSPPPATGILTPYNADRTAAPPPNDAERTTTPDEYPSASVSPVARCSPAVRAPRNDTSAPESGVATAGAQRVSSTAAPVMDNGAPTPAARTSVDDRTWCEGGYRPDLGTNFGE